METFKPFEDYFKTFFPPQQSFSGLMHPFFMDIRGLEYFWLEYKTHSKLS